MDKVILTTFTDPMMGLSYESEPIFRRLETHFRGQITFRYVMSCLVRDIRDFMTPDELACNFQEGIRRYNKRLATIYEDEESLGGMPIRMTDFHLFSETETSSLPLNLAYKAVQLTMPEKADLFLYRLRYATIVEQRPTTELEEIVETVKSMAIDVNTFLTHYNDGSVLSALQHDLQFRNRLGIHSLPAYLLQYQDNALLFQSFRYDDFASSIQKVSEGNIRPYPVSPTLDAIRELLSAHPLISPIEVREAFDLEHIDAVKELIQPLVENQEITVYDVPKGWFIRKTI